MSYPNLVKSQLLYTLAIYAQQIPFSSKNQHHEHQGLWHKCTYGTHYTYYSGVLIKNTHRDMHLE